MLLRIFDHIIFKNEKVKDFFTHCVLSIVRRLSFLQIFLTTMKNKKVFAGGIFGLFALMLIVALVSSSDVSADEETQKGFGEIRNEKSLRFQNSEMQEKKQFIRNIANRSVDFELIENGVIITMTSDNEKIIEKLQSKEHKTPINEKVNKVYENIENGIRMIITSDDQETIAHIQEFSQKPRFEGMKFGKKGNKEEYRKMIKRGNCVNQE